MSPWWNLCACQLFHDIESVVHIWYFTPFIKILQRLNNQIDLTVWLNDISILLMSYASFQWWLSSQWYWTALQWCHNECNGIPNHRRRDCSLNHSFRRRSKKISKLCIIGLCEGNSLVTGFHLMTSSWASAAAGYNITFPNAWKR